MQDKNYYNEPINGLYIHDYYGKNPFSADKYVMQETKNGYLHRI